MAIASDNAPSDTAEAMSSMFTLRAPTTTWVCNRRITAAARRAASQMMTMLSYMKRLAIAFGTHVGSIRANNAWKPIPMAMQPRLVRTQPAKVRSLARSVRSSARSVREKSSIALSIRDQRARRKLVPPRVGRADRYCDCFWRKTIYWRVWLACLSSFCASCSLCTPRTESLSVFRYES